MLATIRGASSLAPAIITPTQSSMPMRAPRRQASGIACGSSAAANSAMARVSAGIGVSSPRASVAQPPVVGKAGYRSENQKKRLRCRRQCTIWRNSPLR